MFHYSILFTFLTVYLYSILALNVHAFHYVNVLLIISPRGLTIVRTSFQSLSELCKSAEFRPVSLAHGVCIKHIGTELISAVVNRKDENRTKRSLMSFISSIHDA
ncbi:hypothetical protein EV424DRAFT_1412797, partial [Suillus variegatus]